MKLLSENIFEFQKGLEPIDSLGLGRRVQIEEWLDKMNINDYIINKDYTINTSYSVYLEDMKLTKLPEFIQFNIVKGDFEISGNELTTLKGCPKKIYGYFACNSNNLTSLKYCPTYIGDCFYFNHNKISNLHYFPEIVLGDYIFSYKNKQYFSPSEIKSKLKEYKKTVRIFDKVTYPK